MAHVYELDFVSGDSYMEFSGGGNREKKCLLFCLSGVDNADLSLLRLVLRCLAPRVDYLPDNTGLLFNGRAYLKVEKIKDGYVFSLLIKRDCLAVPFKRVVISLKFRREQDAAVFIQSK